MPEQTNAGEEHCHTMLVSGLDDLAISNGAARVNYRGDADLVSRVDAITEREECIRDEQRTPRPVSRATSGDSHRFDSTGLSRADADGGETGLSGMNEHDAVTLHLRTYGDTERCQFANLRIDLCFRPPVASEVLRETR